METYKQPREEFRITSNNLLNVAPGEYVLNIDNNNYLDVYNKNIIFRMPDSGASVSNITLEIKIDPGVEQFLTHFKMKIFFKDDYWIYHNKFKNTKEIYKSDYSDANTPVYPYRETGSCETYLRCKKIKIVK